MDRLRELLAINRAIAGTLDFDEVLALVVDKAAELLRADVSVLLLADDGGTARVAAHRGLDQDRANGFAVRLDERINAGLRDLLGHEREDAFLGVPVIHRGSVAGILVVHRQGAVEERDDEELLAALADQAAIALDHASRYRELWRESQHARRELELEAERKDRFLAMLAHELRNPLAAIVNAVTVIGLRSAGDPGVERAQRTASRQAQHMKRLLDDLLDVSRLSRGKVSIERRPVDLREIVDQVVDGMRGVLDENGQGLAVHGTDRPLVIDGDADRLGQVLANLVSNAAKFGARRVEIRLAETAEEAEVRVVDDGCGIEPDLLPVIFDLFVQGSARARRDNGGLGLGLTLVRQLVEMHGGTVAAHSEGEGRGSELVVRLPKAPRAERDPIDAAGAERRAGRSRILVVEDDPDVGSTFAELLEADGHTVAVVADGESALERLAEDVPEVLLVDIGLPGIDGYEVARRVRARGLEPRPLLVAVTGFGQQEDRRRSRDAGFDHHLVKPVAVEQLRQVLSNHAGRP